MLLLLLWFLSHNTPLNTMKCLFLYTVREFCFSNFYFHPSIFTDCSGQKHTDARTYLFPITYTHTHTLTMHAHPQYPDTHTCTFLLHNNKYIKQERVKKKKVFEIGPLIRYPIPPSAIYVSKIGPVYSPIQFRVLVIGCLELADPLSRRPIYPSINRVLE